MRGEKLSDSLRGFGKFGNMGFMAGCYLGGFGL